MLFILISIVDLLIYFESIDVTSYKIIINKIKIIAYILLNTFDGQINITEGTSTEILGQILLSRFVYPFEIVSFVLLAALIGGITLARKDNALVDEDQV